MNLVQLILHLSAFPSAALVPNSLTLRILQHFLK